MALVDAHSMVHIVENLFWLNARIHVTSFERVWPLRHRSLTKFEVVGSGALHTNVVNLPPRGGQGPVTTVSV